MDLQPLIDRTIALNHEREASDARLELLNNQLVADVLSTKFPNTTFTVNPDGITWEKTEGNPTDDEAERFMDEFANAAQGQYTKERLENI